MNPAPTRESQEGNAAEVRSERVRDCWKQRTQHVVKRKRLLVENAAFGAGGATVTACPSELKRKERTMRMFILWLLGVPISVLLLLKLFGVL